MGPLDQLLMAARGHQGLPPEVSMPPEGMGEGMPPGMPMMGGQAGPPLPGPSDVGSTADSAPADDREVASTAAQHLLEAARLASDYELQAALASAAAVLHKYIAKEEKEHQAALGGKLSPRLMAKAHQAQ